MTKIILQLYSHIRGESSECCVSRCEIHKLLHVYCMTILYYTAIFKYILLCHFATFTQDLWKDNTYLILGFSSSLFIIYCSNPTGPCYHLYLILYIIPTSLKTRFFFGSTLFRCLKSVFVWTRDESWTEMSFSVGQDVLKYFNLKCSISKSPFEVLVFRVWTAWLALGEGRGPIDT